jgi:host factor-I protein
MIQENYFQMLVEGKVPVAIYLLSGIRLQGEIAFHDQYGLLLRGMSSQFVYKHAICSILPSRDVPAPDPAGGPERRPVTLSLPKPRLP